MPNKTYTLTVSEHLAKLMEDEQATLAREMGVVSVPMQTVQRKLLLAGLQKLQEDRAYKEDYERRSGFRPPKS